MEEVYARGSIPSRLARLARQLDRPHGEEAAAGLRVLQLDQSSVETVLTTKVSRLRVKEINQKDDVCIT